MTFFINKKKGNGRDWLNDTQLLLGKCVQECEFWADKNIFVASNLKIK